MLRIKKFQSTYRGTPEPTTEIDLTQLEQLNNLDLMNIDKLTSAVLKGNETIKTPLDLNPIYEASEIKERPSLNLTNIVETMHVQNSKARDSEPHSGILTNRHTELRASA